MFEKPAFRESAHSKRCIIYLDGFFEHHHLGKQTYPFYICRKDDYPMAVAGLWSEWLHPLTGEKINTFTIVTTTGNSLMTKIHNHPKQHGPRMPFLLTDELTEFWLSKEINGNSQKQLLEHLQSPASIELKAITVNALRGKRYKGNVPQVTEEVTYHELGFFDFTP
jgi:putative SOS response-associated peptidase YedK